MTGPAEPRLNVPSSGGLVIVEWPAGTGPAPWEPGGTPWQPYEPNLWPEPGEPFPPVEEPDDDRWWDQ